MGEGVRKRRKRSKGRRGGGSKEGGKGAKEEEEEGGRDKERRCVEGGQLGRKEAGGRRKISEGVMKKEVEVGRKDKEEGGKYTGYTYSFQLLSELSSVGLQLESSVLGVWPSLLS